MSLSHPISILVADARERTKNVDCICSVAPQNLPKEAFVQVLNKVCVESPEMCFLEAAKDFNFQQLVKLGNYLCAGYVFDGTKKNGQRDRTPITNVKSIQTFLKSAEGFTGVKLARRASKYLFDNSRSPAETSLATAFFIPISDNGFAVKPGILNGQPQLTPKAISLLRTEVCHNDILWEDEKVVFEYDSQMTHSDDKQRQYDERRRMALEMSGYRVITFTPDNLRSFSALEESVQVLRDALKMKKRPAEFKKFEDGRRQIFHDVIKSTRNPWELPKK